MVRYYFLTLLIIAAVACTRETKVHDRVMTKGQMVAFLIDIYLAEAKTKVLKIDHDSSTAWFRKLEDDVYQKHQINDSNYLESYNYYLEHPDLLLEIYERVIDSLSLKEKMVTID